MWNFDPQAWELNLLWITHVISLVILKKGFFCVLLPIFPASVAIKYIFDSVIITDVAQAAFLSIPQCVFQNNITCYLSYSVKHSLQEILCTHFAYLCCSRVKTGTDGPSCDWKCWKEDFWDAHLWHSCTLILLNLDCCLITAALYTCNFFWYKM